jgi:ubiquinol oxidase
MGMVSPDTLEADIATVHPTVTIHTEGYSKQTKGAADWFAKTFVHFFAGCADFLFQERYCHRAVVLETIAAVPGMVGGLLQHLKSLRFIRSDRGWIHALLEEAENERMHLLIYSALAKPTTVERIAIMVVQFFFFHFYFLLYIITPKTAHRFVGYLEEEAIHSYERYLRLVEEGKHENVPAPEIAMEYWKLDPHARLSDVIKATIHDEMIHRDINHKFADDTLGTKIWR